MRFSFILQPQNGEIMNKKVDTKNSIFFFGKENYIWMGIGAAVVALGMFLMSGGKNQDPNTFDYNVVYSTTRVTVAPILILLGLVIEIYAIFKKSKPVVE
jgi:heme/copper-type cytochrome/quinol oxidase subunit 2